MRSLTFSGASVAPPERLLCGEVSPTSMEFSQGELAFIESVQGVLEHHHSVGIKLPKLAV